MKSNEKIQSWRWRIVKSGNTIKSFSELVNVSPSEFSEYFAGNRHPSINRFDMIEDKLTELGV